MILNVRENINAYYGLRMNDLLLLVMSEIITSPSIIWSGSSGELVADSNYKLLLFYHFDKKMSVLFTLMYNAHINIYVSSFCDKAAGDGKNYKIQKITAYNFICCMCIHIMYCIYTQFAEKDKNVFISLFIHYIYKTNTYLYYEKCILYEIRKYIYVIFTGMLNSI